MMTEVKRTTLGKNGLSKSAGTLTAYHYDAATGIFSGASEEYLPPGVGLPASSTAIPPPDAISGMARVFTGGAWQQVEDHRGETVYRTADGLAVTLNTTGDYPQGTTPLAPATAFDVWNGDAWETDVQAQRAAAERAAEAEKNERIEQAGSHTQLWQTQLMLGIISDSDKASLTRWMRYIQALQAVDVRTAPDVAWPEQPA